MGIMRHVLWGSVFFVNALLLGFFKGSVAIDTEVYDRGCEIGKRSLSTFCEGGIRGDRLGIYGNLEGHVPLRGRDIFKNRWIFSGGSLRKLTPHFTFDVGGRHTVLQHDNSALCNQWFEMYAGVRSDLLMTPQMYLFLDKKHKQWCVECRWGYDFDLSIFDFKRLKLSWNNKIGFLEAKRPYGHHRNDLNRRYHYKYVEMNFWLKKEVEKLGCFYCGPTFVYNTGGTQPWTIVNAKTYRSHFCGLNFGFSLEF